MSLLWSEVFFFKKKTPSPQTKTQHNNTKKHGNTAPSCYYFPSFIFMTTQPQEPRPALKLLHATKRGLSELLLALEGRDASRSESFDSCLDIMQQCIERGGKIIMVGCGKSYKVCDKITCMLNSLSIQSLKLHPVDALHGDIGNYRADKDCLVFVSASGETKEINSLIEFLQYRHSGMSLKMIGVTQYKDSLMAKLLMQTCDSGKCVSILEVLCGDTTTCKEACVFPGLKTPTISLTLTLQLLDAMVIELAYNLYGHNWDRVIKMFEDNHPNGSIGMNNGIHSRSGSPHECNSPVQSEARKQEISNKSIFSTQTFHCTKKKLEDLDDLEVLNVFLTNYFVTVLGSTEKYESIGQDTIYVECSSALDAYRDVCICQNKLTSPKNKKQSFKEYFIKEFLENDVSR